MKQEVWITLRLKGEMDAADNAETVAAKLLEFIQSNMKPESRHIHGFEVCQPGDVIEVEEEADIYGNE